MTFIAHWRRNIAHSEWNYGNIRTFFVALRQTGVQKDARIFHVCDSRHLISSLQMEMTGPFKYLIGLSDFMDSTSQMKVWDASGLQTLFKVVSGFTFLPIPTTRYKNSRCFAATQVMNVIKIQIGGVQSYFLKPTWNTFVPHAC